MVVVFAVAVVANPSLIVLFLRLFSCRVRSTVPQTTVTTQHNRTEQNIMNKTYQYTQVTAVLNGVVRGVYIIKTISEEGNPPA